MKTSASFSTALAALLALNTATAIAQASPSLAEAARATEEGRLQEAHAALAALDPADLTVSDQALFYELLGRIAKDEDPSASAAYYARSSTIEERAYRRYEQALAHDRAGEAGPALIAFAQARALDPANTDILLSEAYALRRAGRDAEASERFEQARAAGASSLQVVLDQAYAERAAGRSDAATALFREGVDLMVADPDTDPALLYGVRRETQSLQDRFGGEVFVAYRSAGSGTGLILPEQDSSFSQAGAQGIWRPHGLYEGGRGLSLFMRGFVTLEEESLKPRDETLQFGAGISFKPFAAHNLNLTAERLFKGGELARNSWLGQVSYGWSDGIDWNPAADSWNYTSAYADLTFIFDDPEFTSAFASVRQGRRFAVAPNRALTPYVTAVAQWTDDSFASRERFEAGAGVAYSVWLDETRYTAPAQRIDFELEARVASGDASDSINARVRWAF